MDKYQRRWEEYKIKSRLEISFEEFMRPGLLRRVHITEVGTVLPRLNKNLVIYPHMKHFGLMFFYKRLTARQILNGPTVYGEPGETNVSVF